MKFALLASYAYWWPLVVRIPDPEAPGKFIDVSYEIRLEPQDQDEALAVNEKIDSLPTLQERTRAEFDYARDICVDWRSAPGGEGHEVPPFNEANFRAAWQKVWFRTAFHRALAESMGGQAARLGN